MNFGTKFALLEVAICVALYLSVKHLDIEFMIQGKQEVTIQKEQLTEKRNTDSIGNVFVSYTVSNIGSESLGFVINARHATETPKHTQPDIFNIFSKGFIVNTVHTTEAQGKTHSGIFNIFSNTADKQSVSIASKFYVGNRLKISVNNLDPGIGITFNFIDSPTVDDYWSDFNVDTKFSATNNVRIHTNQSPLFIWTQRFLLLVLIIVLWIWFSVSLITHQK